MLAHPRPPLLRFVLLWLAGGCLRLTILALPPVLPLIHRDLQLSEAAVGALTGVPVLILGLAAIPGSRLIVRFGARRALLAGLLVIGAASALRGLGASEAMLFAMTLLMGAGVAITQPALPSLVSHWFGASPALATAVYANGLIIAEILSASLTIPLVLPLVGGSWQWSFFVWSLPVLATAALIAAFTPRLARDADRPASLWWPNWRDARLWQVGLLQGGAGIMYFGANAFVPDYLGAIGHGDLVGLCLTLLNGGQLPASFILLAFANRLIGRKQPLIAVSLLSFVGVAGILVPLGWTMEIGSGIVGFGAAFFLISSLALPPIIAARHDVHRFAAGSFAIGYTASFVVPLLGGAAWDLTHSPATAFVPVALGATLVLLMALALPSIGRGKA